MEFFSLIRSISRKEWRFVAGVIAVVMVITAIPYLYGYLTAPKDMVYTGIHHLTPVDTNAVLSMIEQVKQGHNIFLNLYTSEAQARNYVNPFWLSVGWLAKYLRLSGLLALHVARMAWIAVFIFVFYVFLAYFFKNQKIRKLALIITSFASGVGLFFNPFLFNVQNIIEHPTDMWVPESITFLTLYHLPHLIASLTLIVLFFLLLLLAFETNLYRYSLSAGIAAFFLLWFHPFNGPTIYLVPTVYLLVLFIKHWRIDWQRIKHLAISAFLPLPVVLYFFMLSLTSPVIRIWNQQNILPSPQFGMYLIGYGLLLIFCLFGLWEAFRRLDEKLFFLAVWLATSLMLLYVPLSFQRRLSEGLHIPISILAALGIFSIANKIIARHGKDSLRLTGLIIFLAVFLPLSNIQIIGQDFYLYSTKKMQPYYIYQDEVLAMRWLKSNLKMKEIIFSSYFTGNFIPAYSGRVVWIGHGPQTAYLENKKILSRWFWSDDQEAAVKYGFLKKQGISYIFYGHNEKALGSYRPETKDYLKKVYSNQKVAIYKVL